jgi:hypothetical protein
MNDKPEPDTKPPVPAIAAEPKPVGVGDIMESVIAKGDLAKLTPAERTEYYLQTCKSMGLNPLTQPFSYITLNSKLTLYATRSCADQLRKVNNVSLEIVSRKLMDDVLTVHVRARLPDGRVDEDWGSVPFPSTLKGEFRANAELKAVTKAKRRATLSICGLGWLDETEIDDIPVLRKQPRPAKPAYDDAVPDFDAEDTAAAANPAADEPAAPEKEQAPPDQGAAGASVLRIAENKARQGRDALMAYSEMLSVADRKILSANIEHLKALYPK